MARLIPATCPQCGGNVTLNPAHEWVTCSFCRTTSFIETPARRNAPNHPPPHVQVIHVKRPPGDDVLLGIVSQVGGLAGSVFTVLVVGLIVWNQWGAKMTSWWEGESPAAAAPMRAENYYVSATSLRPLLEQEIGPQGKILSLTLSGGTASIDFPTSARLDAFDNVTFVSGKKWDRRPMMMPPSGPGVAAQLLTVSQVPLEVVPKIISDATSRLAIAGGLPVTVTLETPPVPPRLPSRTPSALPVQPHRWRVLIRNERHEQGSVDFDLHGRFIEMAHRPR